MLPRFDLGKIVITTNAYNFCIENAIPISLYLLKRHAIGDWGDLDEHDIMQNSQALLFGGRLFSSYDLPDNLGKLWIITEADRSSTTILLPEDY